MQLNRGRTPLVSLALSCLLATSALAQGQLNTPTIGAADASQSSIVLKIQAGGTGAPSGFTLEYMKKADYDALGGWPSDLNSNAITSSTFDGIPTFHITPFVNDYELETAQAVYVFVGEFFDETGINDANDLELPAGTQYIFRVQANASDQQTASNFSANLTTSTKPAGNGCTFTLGYWKNHISAWPVSSLKLGNVTYNKTQLLSILSQPAGGNGLVILAHQLIAAKLNILAGASSTPVASTITASDALIANRVCPPVGTGSISPSAVNSYANVLDSFNNGNTTVPHCGSTTTKAQGPTWGSLKRMYR